LYELKKQSISYTFFENGNLEEANEEILINWMSLQVFEKSKLIKYDISRTILAILKK